MSHKIWSTFVLFQIFCLPTFAQAPNLYDIYVDGSAFSQGSKIIGCTGQTLKFAAFPSGATPMTIQWRFQNGIPATGTSSPEYVQFFSTGYNRKIVVTATNSYGTDSTYIYLDVYAQPTVSISSSGSLKGCLGDVVNLTANTTSSPAFYTWSDNSTQKYLYVTKPGKYYVEVSNGYCKASDTINVTLVKSVINITQSSKKLCNGDSVLLSADTGYKYLWSNGATSSSIYVKEQGEYNLTATKNSCNYYGHATVVDPNAGFVIQTSGISNNKICKGTIPTLSVPILFKKIQWNTGDTAHRIVVNGPGKYFVYALDTPSCKGYAEIIIGKLDTVKCLSGIYKVGGPSPDYPSLKEALADLQNSAVGGAITYLIRGNIKQLGVKLTNIHGLDTTRPIAFIGVDTGGQYQYISFDSLIGCSYIKFHNFWIGSSFVINSTSIKWENNRLSGFYPHTITGDSLFFFGNSGDFQLLNLNLTGSNPKAYAVLSGNNLTASVIMSGFNNSLITRNILIAPTKYYSGLILYYCTGSQEGKFLVMNNYLLDGDSDVLDLFQCNGITIANNTIVNYTGPRGVKFAKSGKIYLKNNIIRAPKILAFADNSSSLFADISYNSYNNPGSSNIPQIKTLANNSYSHSTDPGLRDISTPYTSNSKSIAADTFFERLAPQLPYVKNDFFGKRREYPKTSVGADDIDSRHDVMLKSATFNIPNCTTPDSIDITAILYNQNSQIFTEKVPHLKAGALWDNTVITQTSKIKGDYSYFPVPFVGNDSVYTVRIPASIKYSGSHDLKFWIIYPEDSVHQNDTLNLKFYADSKPALDFSITSIICPGRIANFINTTAVNAKDTAVKFSWAFSDDATDRPGNQFNRTFSNTGNYSVTLKSTYGKQCSTSRVKTFQVLPKTPAKISRIGDSLVAPSGIKSALWLSNGNVVANAQGFRPKSNGTYKLVVISNSGCDDTSADYVFVATGIDALRNFADNVRIYPNPAYDYLTLDINLQQEGKMQVVVENILGDKVANFTLPIEEHYRSNLSVGNLAPGIYTVKFISGNQSCIKKLIIQK